MKIQDQRGLTLVEVMAVVVILGILAAVAIPRFSNTQKYEVKNVALSLVRDIKYAQQAALGMEYKHGGDKSGVRLKFYPGAQSTDPGTGETVTSLPSYEIYYVDSHGQESGRLDKRRYRAKIELPDTITFSEDIPAQFTLLGSNPNIHLTFNHYGEIGPKDWEGTVEKFVYLQDNRGNKVSIEVTRPWGQVKVQELAK